MVNGLFVESRSNVNWEVLLNNLRRHQHQSLYLIMGQESYLQRLLSEAFKALIPHSQRTMNFVEEDLNAISLGHLLNDAQSVPFLGDHRLIFAKNADFLTSKGHQESKAELSKLIEYFKHPLESSILVFFVNSDKLDHRKKITQILTKTAVVVNLSDFSERELKEYLLKKIQSHHRRIQSTALELLVQRTDGHLDLIMNELPKLFLNCPVNQVISDNLIQEVVTPTLNQNVFDLVRDILNYRVADAVSLYHQLIKTGQPPLRIHAVLLSQFRLLLQVKTLVQNGYGSQRSLSLKLKVHPYRIKLALGTIQSFSLTQLIQADLGLVTNERKLKLNLETPELLFEMFVLKFVNQKA